MMEIKKMKSWKKTLLFTTGFILVTVILAGGYNFNMLMRLKHTLTLFDTAVIAENFRSMGDKYSSRTIHKGENTFKFKYKLSELPESYIYKGEKKNIKKFFERYYTTGLIIVKDDTVIFEKYYNGNSESSKAISWSVAKSFVSALFGIAMAEGYIKDVNQAVTDYLPSLAASGYNKVRIKDVLQMSSGIRFNEDYGDFNSDINRMGRSFALNTPLEEFILSLKNEKKPGIFNHYVSMDTQVLGMIITAATGKTLSEYAEEKLWKPLGMESDALWMIDSAGMEAAFGGLNVVLRDYARFGRLFLNNGSWNGKQIIPASWIKDSTTPDAPHLMPGKRSNSTTTLGYGYQWWIPEKPEGDFLAIGIYGQAIYINQKQKIVIARTSAYADYNKDGDGMEMESIEAFKAIAEAFGE